MAVATAVVAAGAIGAGMSAWGQSQAANAEKEAAEQDQLYRMMQNQRNQENFMRSLGSEGYSFMPYYAKDAEGNPLEPKLLGDYVNAYNQLYSKPIEEQVRDAQRYAQSWEQAQGQADQSVKDLFSGVAERQAIGNMDPVYQARTGMAQSRKQAALDAMRDRLNKTDAQQRMQGFIGQGLGHQRLQLDAQRDAATQGATEMSAARLQNAMDTANIQNTALQQRIQSGALPGQQMAASLAAKSAPFSQTAQNYQTAFTPFTNFRPTHNAFQEGSMPQTQPSYGAGTFAGMGAGNFASGVGNVFGAKYLDGQLNPKTQQNYIPQQSMGDFNTSGIPDARRMFG